MEFANFFNTATEKSPFPYQQRLAQSHSLPLILNAPTGSGKTAAVVISWLWRRRYAAKEIQDKTPRRLLYCLPMRSLVDQTHAEIQKWLVRLNLKPTVRVHRLMGGAISEEWDGSIDQETILVGTQDQLLSRALNRGYGMSRYRWPVQFAQVNNDCFWVIDETQLMGAGLRTTAQLQWFRQALRTYGTTQTLWMSATLNEGQLKTVDYRPEYGDLGQRFELSQADRDCPGLRQRLQAQKSLKRSDREIPVATSQLRQYSRQLAADIIEAHQEQTLTLVVCNRVKRAQDLYRDLEKLAKQDPSHPEIGLIHSRFRSGDRQTLNQRYLNPDDPFQGILVATQVVEAGIDISATTLFTELCPWSSLVQRIGRCNRRGEDDEASVYWLDLDSSGQSEKMLMKAASPYSLPEVQQAQTLMQQLQATYGDVGIESLTSFMETLAPQDIPTSPVEGMVLRRHDLQQLFDTSSDLAGHDIDISPFIRETEDNDLELAWRTWGQEKPSTNPNDPNYCGPLHQDELCRVSLGQAREFLNNCEAWLFNPLDNRWERVRRDSLRPGITILLRVKSGGYSSQLGFTGNPKDKVDPIEVAYIPFNSDQDDGRSQVGDYITLTQHARDTLEFAQDLCRGLRLDDLPWDVLQRAARYHDAGKAHPEFQKMLTWNRPERQGETLWAKSDHDRRRPDDRPPAKFEDRQFRYLRHEWASALLALQQGEDFLLAYLVACHHGKVRLVVQPYPNETPAREGKAYARGVWQDDRLPEIDLGDDVHIPSCRLSLDCIALGESDQGEPSWLARSLDLLDHYGPFRLAYLETVVRVADWRASAQYGAKPGTTSNAGSNHQQSEA